jgi:hypothetical protein
VAPIIENRDSRALYGVMYSQKTVKTNNVPIIGVKCAVQNNWVFLLFFFSE